MDSLESGLSPLCLTYHYQQIANGSSGRHSDPRVNLFTAYYAPMLDIRL